MFNLSAKEVIDNPEMLNLLKDTSPLMIDLFVEYLLLVKTNFIEDNSENNILSPKVLSYLSMLKI